jgi:hypothetical protein
VVSEIRHVAVEEKELFSEEFEGCLLKVTVGDYNNLLAQVDWLKDIRKNYKTAVIEKFYRKVREAVEINT